ncbi:MAG: Ig-like domain-containing protein, partial [Pusillimonas sp.]
VVAQPKSNQPEADSFQVTASKPDFVPAVTQKFDENPLLSISLETSAPLSYSQANVNPPKLRLLAFTPFDFGHNIKSTQLLPPYYKEINLTTAEMTAQTGKIATFTLPLEITGIAYNESKHPATVFADASWLSSSNILYTADLTRFGFAPLTRAFATAISPRENATDTFITNPVIFSFDKQMRANSLESAISIEPAIPFIASYSYTENSINRLTIIPDTTWEYNTQYTVTLATSALDIGGYPLSEPVQLTFTTIADLSQNPALVSPAPSMRNFARPFDSLIVTFPHPVNTNTVVKGTGLVLERAGVEVQDYTLQWDANKTMCTLYPDVKLDELSSYTISVYAQHVKYTTGENIAESLIATFSVCPFSNGFGTSANPFQVFTAKELSYVGYPGYNDKHYTQALDIDLSVSEYNAAYDSGKGWIPRDFSGVYDGDNNKIKNLFINRPDTDDVGLFKTLTSAEIKNVIIETAEVTGNSNVGALCGKAFDTDFYMCEVRSNSHITGTNNNVGGLIGKAYSGSFIQNCTFYGSQIIGKENIGGIAGYQTLETTLTSSSSANSFISGSVKNVGGITGLTSESSNISFVSSNDLIISGAQNIGGITAELNSGSTLEGCHSVDIGVLGNNHIGIIAGKMSGGSKIFGCVGYPSSTAAGYGLYTGGIVGHISDNSRVYRCVSNGRIVAIGHAGGISGYCEGNSYIYESYFNGIINDWEGYEGPVEKINFGGIAGTVINSFVHNSYASGTIIATETSNVGGLVGFTDYSSIRNCYSQTEIDFNDYGAALIGKMTNNSALFCCVALNTSISTAPANWGITTSNFDSAEISNCYALDFLPTTGDPSKDAPRKTNAEFKTTEFYTTAVNWLPVGWDFVSIWQNETEGTTYPTLQNIPGLIW